MAAGQNAHPNALRRFGLVKWHENWRNKNRNKKQKQTPRLGLEPRIFSLEVRRVSHFSTRASAKTFYIPRMAAVCQKHNMNRPRIFFPFDVFRRIFFSKKLKFAAMLDPSATQVRVNGGHTALGSTPALLGTWCATYLGTCVRFSHLAHEYEGWYEPTWLFSLIWWLGTDIRQLSCGWVD